MAVLFSATSVPGENVPNTFSSWKAACRPACTPIMRRRTNMTPAAVRESAWTCEREAFRDLSTAVVQVALSEETSTVYW